MTEQKKYSIELSEQDLLELWSFLAFVEDHHEMFDDKFNEDEWAVMFRSIEHVRAVTEALIDNNDLLPF